MKYGIMGIIVLLGIIGMKVRKKVGPSRRLKKMATIQIEMVNHRKVYRIFPNARQKEAPVLLYLHGGAFVSGMTNVHWKFLSRMVQDTHLEVIFPDYPLVPKTTYQEVLEMIETVYDRMIGCRECILIGDSAGGAIALSIAMKRAVEKKNGPMKVILISPWLDLTLNHPKIEEVQKQDKILNKTALKMIAKVYANTTELTNYLASPLYGPIHLLKEVIIFTGTFDILNPDVHRLKEKGKIKVYETIGAPHIWIVNQTKKYEEDYQTLIKEIDKK